MKIIDRAVRGGLASALALALTACVPGAGDDGRDGVPAEAAAQPVVPDVAPYKVDVAEVAIPESTTSRIVVPPQFDFASDRDVTLSIDIPEARATTSYLSLCLEWEDVGTAAPEVDYGSCVLRTTLDDGRLDTVLPLANHHDALLAVVWFADPGIEPVYREVRPDGG